MAQRVRLTYMEGDPDEGDRTDRDLPPIVIFPEVLDRVLIREEYETRHVGEDTEYVIPAGTIATVIGNWYECSDTHLIMDPVTRVVDGVEVTTRGGEEVWCDPDFFTILAPYVLPDEILEA